MSDETEADGSSSEEEKNTYVLDGESGEETARLLRQDMMLNQLMDPFPEGSDATKLRRVLDIACGPGGWALEVARDDQHREIVGIDSGSATIRYAQANARAGGFGNVRFLLMNTLQPLLFDDASFDFVNARLLAGFMAKAAWAPLLQECFRVTAEKGYIRLTECELPITTSPAFEHLTALACQGFSRVAMSFSPLSRQLGITAMLGQFLRGVGCTDIQQRSFVIDFSADTDAHLMVCEDFTVAYQLLQPFLYEVTKVASRQEVEDTYRRMLIEMRQSDFRAVWYYLTAWGKKDTRGPKETKA